MNKKFLIGLLLFGLIAVNVAGESEITEDDNVLVLTNENFQSALDKYENLLVKFYAPWCGHCKTMAPAFAKAAAYFKNDASFAGTRLAKVDATQHQDLASKYGVNGYPTLKFFVKGVHSDYQGGRSEEQLISWVKKKTSPATSILSSVDAVESLITNNKVAVVFFGNEGTPQFQIFDALAKQFDDIIFGHVYDADVAAHYAPKANLVLFKQFDERRNDFHGDFQLEALKEFVSANKLPLVSEFNQEIAQAVFALNRPALFLFIGNDDKSREAQQELESVAKQLKGQIIVSWAQVREGFGKRLGDYIGVSENQVPTVRLVKNSEEAVQKFVLEAEVTAENLLNFVKNYQEDRLTPSLKSEEIPADNNGPVTVVVGKNFEQVVLDSTKDVLIEFYAPWCGHCKTLAPVWEKLGEAMKSHPSVVIAKCDATANEISGLGIKGFPTIKYFPANNKALPGVEYNSGRTLEDFVKFLEENKTVSWDSAESKTDL